MSKVIQFLSNALPDRNDEYSYENHRYLMHISAMGEGVVGAADGFRFHAVRDYAYAGDDNSEAAKKFWSLLESVDKNEPLASVTVNSQYLLDIIECMASKVFRNSVKLTIHKDKLLVQGTIVDDDEGEYETYALIMAMHIDGERWKPEREKPQFDAQAIEFSAVAP